MKNALLYIFILLYGLVGDAYGQGLNMFFRNAGNEALSMPYKKVKLSDSIFIDSKMDEFAHLLRAAGYWDVELKRKDTLNKLYIDVYPGPKYKWDSIAFRGLPPEIANPLDRDARIWFGQEWNPEPIFMRNLKEMDKEGYPFASMHYENVSIENGKIRAGVRVDPGPKVWVDSLIMKGTAKIRPSYLHALLGIKPDKAFNGQTFASADRILKNVPFWEITRPSEIRFASDKASLHIFASKVQTSFFSGILGFQPGSGIGGKLRLTGDVQLKLWNLLEHGEQFELEWRRIANGTQQARAFVAYPYLFGSPLGVWGNFNFFRRDTTFQTVEYGIGVDYIWAATQKIRFGYQRSQSRLIERTSFIQAGILPPDMDVDWDKLNLELDLSQFDYRYNPLKGYRFHAKFSPGLKRIRPIRELPDSLYAGLPLNSFQMGSELSWEQYFRLHRRWTFYYNTRVAYLFSENRFVNELMRLGGHETLRGFDEESIYTNGYGLLNMELRFLFDKMSNVFIFGNGGFAEQDLVQAYSSSWLYGFGAGIRFGTSAGILNLTYGLGSQNKEAIKLSNSKIHIGFTGIF